MNNFLFHTMNKTMGQTLPIRTATKCFIIASFIFSFCQFTTAQQRLGLATSNYGGVTNLMSNPADIAGSRYRTYIGFGQMDAHFTNNYFKFGSLSVDNVDTFSLLKKNGDFLSVGFDLAGLSWIQNINPKMTFSLSSRARGAFQLVGATPNLYNTLGIANDSTTIIKGGGFNIGAQIFSELDASYAQTLVDNKDYGLKVGATIKRLSGAFATGFSLSQFDAQHITTVDEEKYKISNGQLNIAYIGTGDLSDATNFSPSSIFGGGGKGWGFDVGATYEHRTGNFNDDNGTTPYLFRVGVSVTDVGNIKYSGNDVRYYAKSLKNVDFKVSDTTDLSISDDVLEAAGINKDSFATSFKAQIPAMLRLNADVRITENFFVNAYLAHSIANRYQLGTQYASFVAVTPRLETRYFDFSLPLVLGNNYKTFGMGFGIRLGPVTFGMDNFTGFFGNASGLNAHAGLNIGIGRKSNARDLAQKEKEKEKEAEVAEAKNASKEKANKKSKKAPKEDSYEPIVSTVVAEPKPVKAPETKPMDAKKEVVVAKPNTQKMVDKAPSMPAKTPATVAVTPKPTVSTTVPTTTVNPKETPAKTPATVAVTPKPTVPTTTTKPQEMATKTSTQGPLSTTPQKAATAAVVVPKPTVPVVVEKPKSVSVAPIGSGKMGDCIEFFPNKLNVAASVLATEKVADATALKTERAKTIRNFLIQSGVEASRIAIKMNDAASVAPITLTAQ
jgi:hypothetical protein